jgi:hypothetical protein
VVLIRTHVSGEHVSTIIRVERIGKLGNFTANVLPSVLIFPLMMEAMRSSETPVLTRVTWHHIPEDDILQF